MSSRRILAITGIAIAAIIAIVIIAAAAGGGKTTPPAISHPAATTAPATTAPATVAQPSPAGTGSGSCSYTLGDNPAGDPSTAVATGEVDLTSTGNIGALVKVTIAWPQEGYTPLTDSKTVQMPYNASAMPVEFSMPLTSDQLDNLQNWEEGHNFPDNDCTYHETITGTYGKVQS